MKFLNNIKFIVLAIVHISICSCENSEIITKPQKIIQLNSLKILKNSLGTNYDLHKILTSDSIFDSEYLPLLISSNIKNISNDTIIVFTNEKANILFGIKRQIQIKHNKIIYGHHVVESVSGRWDTLLPYVSKKYLIPHPGPLSLDNGSTLYFNVEIKLCYLLPDTLKMQDSTYLISPHRCEEKVQGANSAIIQVDLLKSEVRLVDSTFEEVLESYKRRGYIEQ